MRLAIRVDKFIAKALGPGLIREKRKVRLPSGKVIWSYRWIRPDLATQQHESRQMDLFQAEPAPSDVGAAYQKVAAAERRKMTVPALIGKLRAERARDLSDAELARVLENTVSPSMLIALAQRMRDSGKLTEADVIPRRVVTRRDLGEMIKKRRGGRGINVPMSDDERREIAADFSISEDEVRAALGAAGFDWPDRGQTGTKLVEIIDWKAPIGEWDGEDRVQTEFDPMDQQLPETTAGYTPRAVGFSIDDQLFSATVIRHGSGKMAELREVGSGVLATIDFPNDEIVTPRKLMDRFFRGEGGDRRAREDYFYRRNLMPDGGPWPTLENRVPVEARELWNRYGETRYRDAFQRILRFAMENNSYQGLIPYVQDAIRQLTDRQSQKIEIALKNLGRGSAFHTAFFGGARENDGVPVDTNGNEVHNLPYLALSAVVAAPVKSDDLDFEPEVAAQTIDDYVRRRLL